MNNHQGQASYLFIFFLLVGSFLLLKCLALCLKSHFTLKKLTHQSLCLKEYIGETKKFIKTVNQYNWYIQQLNRSKKVARFIPPAKVVAVAAQVGEEGLKRLQDLTLVSYLNKLRTMRNKKCPFEILRLQTPYHHAMISFIRRNDGVTKTRAKEWKLWVTKPYFMQVSFSFQPTQKKVDIQLTRKEGLLNWKLLSGLP